ncbi:MAG: transglutaminase-like domain-containing protein [bacterium]
MPIKTKWSILIVIGLVLGLVGSCAHQYPDDVRTALDAAGPNRAALQAVLEHYAAQGDTLKLQAAQFLIVNMPEHCYVTYRLVDTTGAEHDFDITVFDNYDQLVSSFDSLQAARGELNFERNDKILDVETMTSELLIENIDYAFRAWTERPWARFLSFDQFCQYILPYRGSNEPLESWRPYYWERYQSTADSLDDQADPVVAAQAVNADVQTWFGFDPRYYYHPTDQGQAEMLASGLGRCEDMTNVTIYAMRANGLAVTSDYTPAWANSGNNHAWNSILLPGGKVVPFMGAETNPGDYTLHNRAAKVYRKTFAQQKSNLAFQPHLQEEVPRWLAGKNYADVTADYMPTRDVTVHFDAPPPDSVDIAYLCVFNSGEWRAIQWGRIAGDSALFGAMGTGIVYLPALYLNEEITPLGQPFLLSDSGPLEYLVPDSTAMQKLELSATTERALAGSTDGVELQALEKDADYELFCFDHDWVSLGVRTCDGHPLVYDNVPTGALYWLVKVGGHQEERVFQIVDGAVRWW